MESKPVVKYHISIYKTGTSSRILSPTIVNKQNLNWVKDMLKHTTGTPTPSNNNNHFQSVSFNATNADFKHK